MKETRKRLWAWRISAGVVGVGLGLLAGWTMAANADNNSAAAQFQSQASALLAQSPVINRGMSWGAMPDFQIDLRPTINETIDITAPDQATALSEVMAMVEHDLWQAAGSPTVPTTTQVVVNDVQTTTTTTPTITDQTTTTAPDPPQTTTTDPDTTTEDPDIAATAPELPVTGDVGGA